MALNHITFYSKLMEMEMGIDVIIPENKWGYSLAERPKDYKYPVLWLLCGGGFDYTDWQRYTAIELYAAQAGIAVVMPSAYYSGYMDTIHGDYKYFSVITDEISKLAVKLFQRKEKIILWQDFPWEAMVHSSGRCTIRKSSGAVVFFRDR